MLKSAVNIQAAGQQVEKRQSAPAEISPLPPQQGLLRRILKRRLLMHYHRLIAVIVLINVLAGWYGFVEGNWSTAGGFSLAALSNLVVINISLAILIRQQVVINFLFWAATSAPTSWPLSIRRILGKVYHFGGIHVGGAIMGTAWFAVFVGVMTTQFLNESAAVSIGLLTITYSLLGLLLLIVALALPQFRARYHDYFELAHRFGGWAALILFWVQTIMFTAGQRGDLSLAAALLNSPGFWLLGLVTLSVALPWLRLKKVAVEIENPSSHVALVRFNHGVTPFAGSSTAVSRSPLTEWHSFANVPAPGEEGFRLTISRAGDWTGSFIDDLPEKVWVKGIPTAGVGNIDKLFKRVVWIATGSGIGPTLPHLLSQEVPARLVWSTRSPRKTYGDQLVDEILDAQPEALIWDTSELGRPDLVQLAYEAVQEFDAEAVICISNKKLTWQVVYGMESRGIPAYGAIWDS